MTWTTPTSIVARRVRAAMLVGLVRRRGRQGRDPPVGIPAWSRSRTAGVAVWSGGGMSRMPSLWSS